MTTFAPVAAPAPVNATPDQQHQRAPIHYGAAVTHRDLVKDKLRVDPTAIAHKKRQPHEARKNDDRPPLPGHLGRHVDIEV